VATRRIWLTRSSSKTRTICYSAFAVLHSGVTRTPLWAAEHLTRKGLDAAVATERKDTFHEEVKLPPDERADLDDYARSGFDRGHLAPTADMPDEQAQHESFSLANMIPQDPQSNRGLWSGIESAARGLARRSGELYVVSGPIFQGATLQRLRRRVLVPTHIFKAIYDPKPKQAAAYLVENADVLWRLPMAISGEPYRYQSFSRSPGSIGSRGLHRRSRITRWRCRSRSCRASARSRPRSPGARILSWTD
jgi:DNA/RNA endonuclease G (NUC1)